jgi:alpha-D-ribose 1-methylphosphonate 5-triphosphate diphosphatase PhnM
MSNTSGVLSVEMPVFVDSELGLNSSGLLKVIHYVSVGDDDDIVEIETFFDDMIDSLVESYMYENDARTLLDIASELRTYAEALEMVANYMDEDEVHWSQEPDDFMTTSDLYDELDK